MPVSRRGSDGISKAWAPTRPGSVTGQRHPVKVLRFAPTRFTGGCLATYPHLLAQDALESFLSHPVHANFFACGLDKGAIIYILSPYKLIWNGDYYYVVGFSEKHGGIGSFRLDRIVRQPQILDEDSVQPPEDFDLNVYLNSMFRMYNGERKQIELVCDNSTMDAIIDKFGKDVTVYANDMQSFKAVVTTSLGNVFYSWIFGFGGKVAIKSPQDVREQYFEMVRKAYESL